jgi:hypothetical protein
MNDRGKKLLSNLLLIGVVAVVGYLFIEGSKTPVAEVSQQVAPATTTAQAVPAEPVPIESARIFVPHTTTLVKLSDGYGRYAATSSTSFGEVRLASEEIEQEGRVYVAFSHSIGTGTPEYYLAYLKRGNGTLDHVDSAAIGESIEIERVVFAEFGVPEDLSDTSTSTDAIEGDSIVVEYLEPLLDGLNPASSTVPTVQARAFFESREDELQNVSD